jgi:hypothetical protein
MLLIKTNFIFKDKKMNKKYIFGILFFSGLWGLSEAVLGGSLYNTDLPYSSVYLTVIALSILTIARIYLPGKGVATAIAAFAMLYKFMNMPFFACHLLGILILGLCYDLFFNVLRSKNLSLSAVLTTYTNYSLFALMITYVFRYSHWVQAGSAKIIDHIFIGGTLAALSCALAVPLSQKFGRWLQTGRAHIDLASSLARARLAVVTTGMWLFALVVFVMQYHRS